MNQLDNPTQLSPNEIKSVFSDLNKKSDRIINYLLLVQFLFGIFIAFFYDTWLVAIAVGGSCLVLYYAAKWLFPEYVLYQYVLSAVSAIFAAQFIYQMHGLFEMHFWVFISSTIMIIYRNWRLQIPLILIVIIHHGTFAYLQYIGIKEVYFTQLDYMDFTTFVFHGVLAAAVTGISGGWAYMLYNQAIKDAIYSKTLNEQREELLVAMEQNHAYTEELRQTAEGLHISNEQLSQLNNLLQKQNFNINSSIQYAQRIQKAFLPGESRIEKIFPGSFVLYKPRDIVSGDFFWVEQIGSKKILVVADCTGHGVPGAFMSLIGLNFIYQIVKIRYILSPAQILNNLRIMIYEALNQNSTGNQDGMDISIVVINSDTDEIYFAGAKSSIIIFDDTGRFKILKGDKMSIGGYSQSENFENFHEYTETLGDKVFIYAFTDGYRDQIGGKEKRKLGFKHFTDILSSLYHYPGDIQKNKLESFIEEWKKQGNEKQLDDILVMGVPLKEPIAGGAH